MGDCTLEMHSEDLTQVIDYLKKDFDEIYLVGHSLGGPTILFSKLKEVKSIVLWDPSYDILSNLKDEMEINEKINKYTLEWGTQFLLSPKMIESWKGLPERQMSKFRKPTKIICAEEGILYKEWKEKFDKIDVEKELIVIPKAGHCFDEEGTEEILFDETLKWFT